MSKSNIFKILGIILGINIILFNGIASDKKQHLELVYAEDCAIKNVIFDLGDVLFYTPKSTYIKLLGPLLYKNPSLITILCTKNIKHELFALLKQIPAQTTDTVVMYNQGTKIPQIMVDWMTGRPNLEILQAIQTELKEHHYSTAQKEILATLTNQIFNPQEFVKIMQPIKSMIQLAQAFKAKGYKLYILSNWDAESFPLLQQKYHDIFDLFDGIMISGQEKIGKPNQELYNRLLNRYNLNAQECLFIDDEKFNIFAAEQINIKAIWKLSINDVIAGLYKINMIKDSSLSHA